MEIMGMGIVGIVGIMGITGIMRMGNSKEWENENGNFGNAGNNGNNENGNSGNGNSGNGKIPRRKAGSRRSQVGFFGNILLEKAARAGIPAWNPNSHPYGILLSPKFPCRIPGFYLQNSTFSLQNSRIFLPEFRDSLVRIPRFLLQEFWNRSH
ncbi:hypothetical protein TURU_002058 [Turdus rufiventris]|nr:hypothetical protein TURU_002058 [Turdus rufiventris]